MVQDLSPYSYRSQYHREVICPERYFTEPSRHETKYDSDGGGKDGECNRASRLVRLVSHSSKVWELIWRERDKFQHPLALGITTGVAPQVDRGAAGLVNAGRYH